MNNRPIGVFDSGAGGLTVVKAMLEEMPREHIIYYGDNARFPYGTKDLEVVKGFVLEICQYLEEQGVKLIVIACNTGTAAGLAEAQMRFDRPILGVVEPGARAAVLATVNRRVGVIGTTGTIRSSVYDTAIHAVDAGIEVYSQACPLFVDFAEGHDEGFDIIEVAEGYLGPLKKAGVDTVILGCTHFPLVIDVIKAVMPEDVTLISSAAETAVEVKETLCRRGFLREERAPARDRFIVSGDGEVFLRLSQDFLGREITDIEQVKLGGH